ncbi:MAG: hypothetical protein ACI9TY_001046 [Alphaproteobacteria bacterium]|jgi:hypothetical protein
MGINHAINDELLRGNGRYRKLHDQHLELKSEIHEAKASPSVDVTKITLLKRKKLRLADEMFTLANRQ